MMNRVIKLDFIASIADVSKKAIESLKKEMRSQNFECWECTLGGPGVALT